MLDQRAGRVLQALGYDRGLYTVSDVNGAISISYWDSSNGLQPDETTINNYATDATPLPSGQNFSGWLAEHGGNATLTAKKLGKDIIDASTGEGILERAILKVIKDEINILRSLHALANRSDAQIKNAILAEIDAA